jgi:hypothetical protein
MLATIDRHLCGYEVCCIRNSTDILVGFGDRSRTDVLVCRAMDSFWLED